MLTSGTVLCADRLDSRIKFKGGARPGPEPHLSESEAGEEGGVIKGRTVSTEGRAANGHRGAKVKPWPKHRGQEMQDGWLSL